jgi:hypothetical protein
MCTYGANPYLADCTAGTQVSSTNEGRYVTLLESLLTHPTHADGFVDKGDPIVCGDIVGVSMNSADAATDYVVIDTEGIWNLSVVATNDAGNSQVDIGELLYINTSTGVLSLINNTATQRPFGRAMCVLATGTTGVIAVKVHADPALDTEDQMYKTVTSGAYNYGKQWTGILAAGQSTGVGGYFSAQVGGAQTGGIYGWGAWTEPGATFVGSGLLVAGEFGIWDGQGANIAGNSVVLLQLQGILAATPATLYVFRVNVAQVAGNITAIFASANPESIGYSAGTAGTGVVGTIPLANCVGPGMLYVDVHAAVV